MGDLARECGNDFVGVQNYFAVPVGPDGPIETRHGYTAAHPDVSQADGLSHALKYAAERSGCPLLITESGLVTTEDRFREEFLHRAARNVSQCISDGVKVLGYTYWSFLDSWEFQEGFSCIMGLVAVDRESGSFTRSPKHSATVLGQ